MKGNLNLYEKSPITDQMILLNLLLFFKLHYIRLLFILLQGKNDFQIKMMLKLQKRVNLSLNYLIHQQISKEY